MKEKVKEGTTPVRYSVDQQRLLFEGRLVIPKGLYWVSVLFKEFHEGVVGGNSRV